MLICLELECRKVNCSYCGGEKEQIIDDAVAALVTRS